MALEPGDYINDLTITNPPANDPKSQGDDHLRLIKKVLKESINGFGGNVILTATDTGAANAYVLTPTTALVGYVNKMLVLFTPAVSNTGASTINISGLGAKSIKYVRGADVIGNDLRAGEPVLLQYDGTNFVTIGGFPVINELEQLSLTAALPAQTGSAGKFLRTSGTVATWEFSGLIRDVRTSNTILSNADNRDYIDVTSGTFTQTFSAASTFQSDWYVVYKNSGTGVITFDPDASETIDGLTSYKMYPGESRLIQCNGTSFFSIVLSPFYHTITSTEVFTHPPGYKLLDVDCVAAGGGGGGARGGAAATQRSGGTAGGGGARVKRTIANVAAGTITTATIGAGGTGGAGGSSANGVDGTAGGNTSFGAYITAYGGGQGLSGGTGSASGGGGGGSVAAPVGSTGGLPSIVAGFNSGGGNGSTSGGAGESEWGGGGGGGATSTASPGGAGGSSINGAGGGGGGGGVSSANSESAGGIGGGTKTTINGTGGTSGAVNGGAGGAGADGVNGYCGSGGGGGGGQDSGTGGAGGAGGAAGGGGGGGGSGTSIGGAGGAGGRGEIRIMGIA